MVAVLATVCAAIWAWCCLYLSLIERPGLDLQRNQKRLRHYLVISRQLTPLLIGVVFAGSALGIYAWLLSGDRLFLYGGGLLAVMFPLSSIFVVTDSQQVMEVQTDVYGETMKAVFRRWFYVHILRTALSLVTLALFIVALWRL